MTLDLYGSLSGSGPLYDQLRALHSGSTTSLELTVSALERARSSQSTLNCFRRFRGDAAIEEASSADAHRETGEDNMPPLLGIPIAIKDDTDIAGLPTAFGCGGTFPDATRDAEVVTRLRRAGAIIIGKTNTPELGQWPLTSGKAFGYTQNPWKQHRTPGGSSGGSAAAVSAGIVAVALGSDGAGSVRIPSSWTNLVGLKPQLGRVPTDPWDQPFNGLTVNGPIARTVDDLELLFDAIADPDPSDAIVFPERRLRIAVSRSVPNTGTRKRISPELLSALDSMAGTLADLGHVVFDRDIDYGYLIGLQLYSRSMPGFVDWDDRIPDFDLLEGPTKDAIKRGRLLKGAALKWALNKKSATERRLGAIFDDADVVLTPTTATAPPSTYVMNNLRHWQIDQTITRAAPIAWPWNIVGWPAIAIPAGFTADSLPVGVQAMGPANSERLLIGLARELERVLHWEKATPARWW